MPLEEPGRPKAQRITVITCEATNRFLADRVWPRMGACCGDRSVMGLRSPRLSRMAVTLSWSTRTARARDVRTPVLLLYAGDGTLARQGHACHRALTAAGVPADLVMVPGADHVFSSAPAGQLVREAVTAWAERHQVTDP